MDQLERAQIRLLLEHLTGEAFRDSAENQKAMHADHAAKGLLRSGNTVRQALKIAEAAARELLTKAVDQVATVSQNTDAFAMIVASVTAAFNHWDAEVAQAVTLASGEAEGSRFPSVKREADRLFAEMRSRLLRELEIYRFTFTKPSKARRPDTPQPMIPAPGVTSEAAAAKNKGGRPPAEFWDDMWAAIAVQLYDGTLQPKTQADVERAMAEWITANGHDAASSTIRGRARRLATTLGL